MFEVINEDEPDCVVLVVLEVKKNETVRTEMKRMRRRRLRICEG